LGIINIDQNQVGTARPYQCQSCLSVWSRLYFVAFRQQADQVLRHVSIVVSHQKD
jgi:hypothetical protein